MNKPTVAEALAAEISETLTRIGRRWKVDGKLIFATPQDVKQLLDRMVEELYTKNYTQIQSGGLLVIKNDDHFDVYVHTGEIK